MAKIDLAIRVVIAVFIVFFFVFYFGLKNNDEIIEMIPNGFYLNLEDRVGIISGHKKEN